VDVISYQKQVIGREISAGVFDFLNGNIFDVGVGERAMEPLQLAVRSTIERSVLEMTANLYGVPNSDACGALARDSKDVRVAESVTGKAVARTDGVLVSDGAVRSDPDRWNAKRDPNISSALRGRSSK
jgi:curli production assembly/transport component CsgG/holdfast attachment protein HfaB